MRKFIAILMCLCIALSLCGCVAYDTATHLAATPAEDGEKLQFMAEFYDNYGNGWLKVQGTEFDIQPNKVKEYGYDSEGYWTYSWAMSSVMSITVDGKHIEQCGSTALFYDMGLEKIDMELPAEVELGSDGVASIGVASDLRWKDYVFIDWWWRTAQENNKHAGSRIVVIQSQNGDSICMFSGDNVEWELCENLPKTTELTIDGRKLFVHRANFAIIDTEVFAGGI